MIKDDEKGESKHQKHEQGEFNCDNCDEDEDKTHEHVTSCLGWRDELGSLNVLRMEDAVEFFSRVMRKKEA